MNKVLSSSALGIAITFSGITSGYFYFIYYINVADSSIMLLISALILVAIGLFFIHKAISSALGWDIEVKDQGIPGHAWFEDDADHPISDKLKNNEAMIKEWEKTNKTREELKLLEAAAAVEEPKKRF